MPDLLRAAAIQLTATPDKARNLDTADRLVRAAAADGATLIVLPEKWSVLGTLDDLNAGAEPLDGPALSWAREIARELDIDLIAGSIAERIDGQRNGNTSVHIGPDGDDRAIYRKIHLFDVEVGGTVYRESDTDQPGNEIVVSGNIGMSICYDLRFPELYAELAARGAQIIVVPAAFTEATTQAGHWETLLRARSIETQCFVVAANQVGEHVPGMRSGGRSMIIDPWGEILAAAPDGESFVAAGLDLQRLGSIRQTLPSLASRRPDIYRA